METESTECAYCRAEITDQSVPDVDDDDSWVGIAKIHAPDCEWVVTRAHRVNDPRDA